jgi:DNA-binding HxlR family transcriptional regulator
MAMLTSKWSLVETSTLHRGLLRNGELIRRVEGISQTMLTQALRQLEEMKLAMRRDMQTAPPYVEYELTELGVSFRWEVRSLIRWVEGNLPDLQG